MYMFTLVILYTLYTPIISCVPMFTLVILYTLYTLYTPIYLVYMFTLVILYTLYKPNSHRRLFQFIKRKGEASSYVHQPPTLQHQGIYQGI